MSTWQADVARARWRADLLEYSAAGLESIGHTADAEAKLAKATRGRAFADLVEEYETARDGMDRESDEYFALRDEFAEARRAMRKANGRGQGNDEAGEINTVHNFAEPSDDELLGVKS